MSRFIKYLGKVKEDELIYTRAFNLPLTCWDVSVEVY